MKRLIILLTAFILSLNYAIGQKSFDVTIPYDVEYKVKQYPKNKYKYNEDALDFCYKYSGVNIGYAYSENEQLEFTENVTYKNVRCKIKEVFDDVYDTIVITCANGENPPKYTAKHWRLSDERKFVPYHKKWSDFVNVRYGFEVDKRKYLEYLSWKTENQKRIEKRRIDDSIMSLKQYNKEEKRQREKAIADAEKNRKLILGDYEFKFYEPKTPIKTKSFRSAADGSLITYTYYVGENGYEVLHGKYTKTLSNNNSSYLSEHNGFITTKGNESLTCHYRNGILHGKLIYRTKSIIKPTIGNDKIEDYSYNLDIYKGILTGKFTVSHKGIKYSGNAVNGIIDYCNYETHDGFHGSITSDCKKYNDIGYAIVSNGYYSFPADFDIDLTSTQINIPNFRFPLRGLFEELNDNEGEVQPSEESDPNEEKEPS